MTALLQQQFSLSFPHDGRVAPLRHKVSGFHLPVETQLPATPDPGWSRNCTQVTISLYLLGRDTGLAQTMAGKRQQEGPGPGAGIGRISVNTGSSGRAELRRQSNRIPKAHPPPLRAGSRACHCPRPVKPPRGHQSQQAAPGTGRDGNLNLCQWPPARDPPPASATSPSLPPEEASLRPQPGCPILLSELGKGILHS